MEVKSFMEQIPSWEIQNFFEVQVVSWAHEWEANENEGHLFYYNSQKSTLVASHGMSAVMFDGSQIIHGTDSFRHGKYKTTEY